MSTLICKYQKILSRQSYLVFTLCDDVIDICELWKPWWRHQMETFSTLLVTCAGNSPVPGKFPAQRPVTRSFTVFFDLRLGVTSFKFIDCVIMKLHCCKIPVSVRVILHTPYLQDNFIYHCIYRRTRSKWYWFAGRALFLYIDFLSIMNHWTTR